MVDGAQLEKSILEIISGIRHDDWVGFSIGDLRNRLSQFRWTTSVPSDSEVVDCICSLETRSLIAVRKLDGFKLVSLTRSMSSDEIYMGRFFWSGTFDLKLTHEGRKAIGHIEVNVASSADEMDDRLPLYRQRVFDADLERGVKESLGSGFPFALVMIDVDEFKQFNDAHGHQTGDEVLKAVSMAISKRVQGKGKAYRYGGDELATLLPNYSKMEAVALAETIRGDIEQSELKEKKLKVTASFGIAVAPEDARVAKELFHLADTALMSAKRHGRNTVKAAGDVEEINEGRAP